MSSVLQSLGFVVYLVIWAAIVWRFVRRDGRPGDWAGSAAAVALAGAVLLLVAYYGDRHQTEPLAVLVFSIVGALLFVSGVLTFVLNALPPPRRRR